MRPHPLAFLVPLAVLVLAGGAAADTLHVPQDHVTIQAAVDAAADGDTILVKAGTYPEQVTVTGKTSLTIKGQGKVVIDPPGDVDALTLVGCTDVTLRKLRVTGAFHGIRLVDCSGGEVLKCRVEGVLGTGIMLEGCDGVTVESCRIDGTGNFGIGLDGDGANLTDFCVVRRNRVHAAAEEGVDVNGAGNVIEKNVIIEPSDNGLRDGNKPGTIGNAFIGNKVLGAGFGGIRILGIDDIVKGNTVVEAGEHAIRLSDGSGHLVQDNRLIAPGVDGVSAPGFVGGVTVSGNKIKSPGAHGVDVRGDGPVVVANVVKAAGSNGFRIEGSGGAYDHCIAKGSEGSGFRLESGSMDNTLTFNKASGSKAGFDLDDASAPGANSIDDTNHFKTSGP
jgi:hypothetical protein